MGSGGAGMCAALRASDLGQRVVMVEKDDVWGGNTAMSAGAVWVPGNRSMNAKGIADTEDDGVRYLMAVTSGEVPEARLRAFVRDANRMVDYLEQRTRVRFEALTQYPDYHDELPGGRAGGRALEPVPLDGALLGDEFATLHEPYPGELMLGKFMMSVPEARSLLDPGVKPMVAMARGMTRYALRGVKRRNLGGRDPHLTMGQALAARLRLSLRDRQVPLRLACSVGALVVSHGCDQGATVARKCRDVRIRARSGVVVAAGSVDRHFEMRHGYA